MRGELRSAIAGDMERNTVLGEYVMEEQFRDLGSIDFVVGRNTNELFAGAIYNVEDGGVAAGGWQLFNKVEGD